MLELWGGILLFITWGVLQFVVQPATGWIHVVLIAAVGLLIRGIVRRQAGDAR